MAGNPTTQQNNTSHGQAMSPPCCPPPVASNHFPHVKAAIQYSVTLLQSQDDFPLDFEPSDEEDVYSHLQNPTKTPFISKDFLRVLPLCPIIHWASHVQFHPNHRGKK
jgi:hypothetical protein